LITGYSTDAATMVATGTSGYDEAGVAASTTSNP